MSEASEEMYVIGQSFKYTLDLSHNHLEDRHSDKMISLVPPLGLVL